MFCRNHISRHGNHRVPTYFFADRGFMRTLPEGSYTAMPQSKGIMKKPCKCCWGRRMDANRIEHKGRITCQTNSSKR